MNDRKYDVAGIGAALVDTEILVSEGDLESLQLEKGLMTLSDEQQQARNLAHLREHVDSAERASGGSAANSLIALARLGSRAHLTCQVADDDDGQYFTKDLTEAGVDFNRRNQHRGGTTGTCLVMITRDAERTMNTCLGISEHLSHENIEPDVLKNSKWAYLEGYLATSDTGLVAAREFGRMARKSGTRVALSLSDPGIVKHFGKQLESMAEGGLDLIFGNREEVLAFTGCHSIDSAGDALIERGWEFAITLGAEGAYAGNAEGRWKIEAEPVRAIDTNGAGDAFAGAYLHALCREVSTREAAQFACSCAGRVVGQMGPRLSLTDAEKLVGETRWQSYGESALG